MVDRRLQVVLPNKQCYRTRSPVAVANGRSPVSRAAPSQIAMVSSHGKAAKASRVKRSGRWVGDRVPLRTAVASAGTATDFVLDATELKFFLRAEHEGGVYYRFKTPTGWTRLR